VLLGKSEAVSADGYIDFYGFYPPATGWFFCGWLPLSNKAACEFDFEQIEVRTVFESSEVTRTALVVMFKRSDLGDRGTGVVLFVDHSEQFEGRLRLNEFRAEKKSFKLEAAAGVMHLRDAGLVERLRTVLWDCIAGHKHEIMALLGRRGYTGVDTIDSLSGPIRIAVDEVIICQPAGIALIGWWVDPHSAIVSLSLFIGDTVVRIDEKAILRIDRQDVIDTVGQELGFNNPRCGFIAFLPTTANVKDTLYIQVQTRMGEVGFLTLRPRGLSGMAAIRRILDSFEVQYGDVRPAYDRVIGPSLSRLGAQRLRVRPQASEVTFGSVPDQPTCSIIVPLYGRVDYIEYQLGLMSAHSGTSASDIIYILDDPPKRSEAEALAESAFERFGVPFRLLVLSENVGFAPANNVALAYAHGNFVCFLNSDVFPGTPDWLERLCSDLEMNADIGIIGPLLLYEDGSIQHQGMAFELIQSLGGFRFPIHTRKGWRPRFDQGLQRQEMITGACMVIDRALATKLGGFDERYLIGDFEDCDLCAKVRAEGFTCAVDHEVQLYHLERRSQATSDQRWRHNLTLYNAWRYEDRWFPGIPIPQNDASAKLPDSIP
jgi:GT2 family glycosyltransferase